MQIGYEAFSARADLFLRACYETIHFPKISILVLRHLSLKGFVCELEIPKHCLGKTRGREGYGNHDLEQEEDY